MAEWRTDTPDWHDGGKVELKCADGTIVRGKLTIEDVGFDGEDEYPTWNLIVAGKPASLWDFAGWRAAGEGSE